MEPGEVDEPLTSGQVVAEHRGTWEVLTDGGERVVARLPGLARHEAEDRRDLPVVGDRVVLAPEGEDGVRLLQSILPRTSLLVRRAAGRAAEPQPIAANVDRVLVVTSVGPELKPARLERYLAGAAGSGATVAIIVNKVDRLPDDDARARLVASLSAFEGRAPTLLVSATSGEGISELRSLCRDHVSVLVGSSGVGKSTLANLLLEREAFSTAPTRRRDDEGRHTTRRRELWPIPGGGAIVDTPGMREFGVWGEGDDTGPRRGR